MKFTRIDLPYKLDGLEPYISKKQIQIHYERHHSAYEKNFNKIIEDYRIVENNPVKILRNYLKLPREAQSGVRQFGGGLLNHNHFFGHMLKNKELHSDMAISSEINDVFGTFDDFQRKFNAFAMGVFGSGWTWLTVDSKGSLRIYNTYNQDTPWFLGMKPLLGIDVWEHAYYIDHLNDRKAYIEAYWNVINWEHVNNLYLEIKETLKNTQ